MNHRLSLVIPLWSRSAALCAALLLLLSCGAISFAQTEDAFGDGGADPVKLFERGQNAHVHGDLAKVKWIGRNMSRGSIRIVGNVGMHLGAYMRGGSIEVAGRASDWVGGEMRGGQIHVRGDAAHHAGAGYPGSLRGMRGGVILIDGRAGDGLGAAMRRGIIAAGGSGDFAGASMIAGSLFLFGAAGRYAGAGMKRGCIVVCGHVLEMLPTFRLSCTTDFPFLTVYFRRLSLLGYAPADLRKSCRATRYCGDVVERGLGEILHVA